MNYDAYVAENREPDVYINTKWSITDFDNEDREKLANALATDGAVDVYIECSKEPCSAKIMIRKGFIKILCWAAMDDIDLLIEDAEWELYHSFGSLDNEVYEQIKSEMDGDSTEVQECVSLARNITVGCLISNIDETMDAANKCLDDTFEKMKIIVRDAYEREGVKDY